MNEEVMACLSGSPTPEQNRKSVLYFEELQGSEFGWQMCVHAVSTKAYSTNEHARFFCFQIIETYVKNRFNHDTPDNQNIIRNFLRMWPNIQSSSDSIFIRNKVAQVASLAFIQDFPHRWPGFFNDLLQTLSYEEHAVDFYLRVLKGIDNEIADRDIARTPNEIQKNNTIRNAMRETSILSLVDSWFEILSSFETTKPELVILCHQVIGAYILWIDINVIANDRFVPILVRALNNLMVRESAADCIYDIISKGMEPLLKVKLVESFCGFLSSAGIWQVVDVTETDADYLAKLGKILNGMGINLVESYNKLFKASDSRSTEFTISIMEGLQSLFTLLLQFLGNEDDDVSASVFDFLRDYLHLLKTKKVLSEVEMYQVTGIVKVLCRKIRFDPEYDFEHEGESEALFKKFRKLLKTVFENLISVDKPLVIDELRIIIEDTFRNWRQLPFQDVEAALYLLHMLGESTPPGLSNFSNEVEKYSTIQKLLLIMAESEFSLHLHHSVTIQCFEVSVRFEKFYSYHNEFYIPALTAFVTCGLFHPDVRVRSRSAYLLLRFIKATRSHLNPQLTQQILLSVQPILEISDPLIHSYVEPLLSDDDQLYVYEVVGVVILAGETEAQNRSRYMGQGLRPLLAIYHKLTTDLCVPVTEDRAREAAICRVLSHIVCVVGRLSKAFSPQETMKGCGCVEMYLEALETFLAATHVLNIGNLRFDLVGRIRQYFHRLVVCLDTEVLKFVPAVSHIMLGDFSIKHLMEYIPLITQVITKFKKDVSPILKDIFTKMLRSIFQLVANPLEENDETGRRDIWYLQRHFYLLISAIVGNSLFDVLPIEETPLLHNIIACVVQGSVNYPCPIVQRTCFIILRKLIDLWGGHDEPHDFAQFMYTHILPACFEAPLHPTFQINDAQCIVVLNETAMCLKSMFDKRGEEFLVYLRMSYLPSFHFEPLEIEAYIYALQRSLKEFKSYLKALILKQKPPI